MKKRQFIKNSFNLAAGSLLFGLANCKPKVSKRTNWAGNLHYATDNLLQPANESEVAAAIKNQSKLRVLGTTHCFNTIADSDNCQLSSGAINKVLAIDPNKMELGVGAGIKYGAFAPEIDQKGYAIHNLASLPHISVAGACATATHGSGLNNGCLATAVSAIEFVNGKGETIKLNENDADFYGAVVNLGCLGMVTKLSLKLLPTFTMRQVVYQNMPMEALKDNFEKIMGSGYSLSLFTDWRNKNISEVWLKAKSADLAQPAAEFYGAKLATKNLHPIESLDAINCTEQLAIEGPWYERMPHFKMGFTPSSGKELQAEYFVDIKNAYPAFMAIEALNAKISPHLFISEVRSIAADMHWMSPFYQKKCVAFHFTWKQEPEAVLGLLPQIEAALAPYEPRPHWGKLFTLEPKVLQARIPKLEAFKTLMHKHDPEGKFRNEFIDKNLFS